MSLWPVAASYAGLKLLRTYGCLKVDQQVLKAAESKMTFTNLQVLGAPILIDEKATTILGPLKSAGDLIYNAVTPLRFAQEGYDYIDHHWIQADICEHPSAVLIVDKTFFGNIQVRWFDDSVALRERMNRYNVRMSSVYRASEVSRERFRLQLLLQVVDGFPCQYNLLDDNCKHLARGIAESFGLYVCPSGRLE
uniref:Uncharacterized protein n=1 Tax=Chromera velia CCMP2878 TaxID=1169474 RepID=A0A0G4HPA9_9ALVE|mmetsp:Transcript_33223/g.65939  ORF Transcript_33223/g.65939 Transcript_33223/m.65939 type:complete len:194 (+) Transcript_33223:222-803(+)|eukprot:Cvel_7776.t1-p1 / transcript=Cvel_7776.t1 / gene=Cvel_7776 / organism=Chromera_velia_CCMP2878 / gene_product=hypothetical protein / transcript_product=hypothetical protein / location=Cvel_scaffold414:69445-71071(+) / protein_length=193 / sequence_SO=supercontig / SO=protein_coding / is_pseudo=false